MRLDVYPLFFSVRYRAAPRPEKPRWAARRYTPAPCRLPVSKKLTGEAVGRYDGKRMRDGTQWVPAPPRSRCMIPCMLPYERFEAWRAAYQLALEVYRATRSFPPEERFGLTSQARRAAYSAAANIAEGSAKRGSREFRRFLDISLGSLSEVAYALRLAHDLGLLSAQQWKELDEHRDRAGKLCWQLYRSLRIPTADPYRFGGR